MHNQRQHIPVIPVIPTPVTNTPMSIWQRARAAATVIVTKARAACARVVAAVAKKVIGARASITRIARAAMVRRPWTMTRGGASHVVQRATNWCRAAWYRVVRPFMRVRVAVLGIGVAVVGLVVFPVTTLVILAGCGLALVGLSKVMAVLEASRHPAAHMVLLVIEFAAQVARVLAYVVTGAMIIALSLVSAAFAVTEALELVLRYFDLTYAASIAALAFFVLTANWALALVEITWLALAHTDSRPARRSVGKAGERQEIPLIRIDAERAWNGGPDVVDAQVVTSSTSACMGCDRDDGGPRFGAGDLTSLCCECFSFLMEDEMVNAAERGLVSAEDVVLAIREGVPVPAAVIIASGARLRSTRVALDLEDITCRVSARIDSEKDPSKIYWAETAWWFDGRAMRHGRQWHGFVAGRLSARIEFEHAKGLRGFYVMRSVTGETDTGDYGPYRTLVRAQEVAADEFSDLEAALASRLAVDEPVISGKARSAS